MPQPRGLFFTYSDFHRCYVVQLNRILAPYHMYSTQWSVLKRLYHIDPPTLAQLAKIHNVEAPTMTACVKKLVRLGYAVAIPGKDRRRRNISLTHEGRAVYEETQRLVDALTARIQGDIPHADMEAAIGLFITLKKKHPPAIVSFAMPEPDNDTRIFSSSFIAVSAINLCVMTGYYLLFIIMGPFAAERFNAAPNMAGLVAGFMILGCLAGRFVTGGSVQRIGFKKVLYVGLVLYTGSMALYLVTDNMPLLLANRFVGGVGVGCIGTMTGTIVACILPARQRGLGISYFSLSTIIALAAGPFLAISLMQILSYSSIFLICMGFGILSFILALGMTIRQPEVPEENRPATFKLADYVEYRAVPLGIVVTITSLSYCTVQTFLSFYARELHLMGAASLFFLVYAAVVFASRPLTGKIFDRRGENIVMYPAIVLTAGSLLVLSVANSAWMMLLSAALLGAGFGNFQSLAQAASLKLVPVHRFGQATSTYYMLFDLGIGVGPFLFGYIVPIAGYSGLYRTTAIVILACLPLYYLFHGRKLRA